MPKFRKRPIVIEAYQTDKELDIETLEGIMHASVGDWIITGIKNEKYPCKSDIFEMSYEEVTEDSEDLKLELEAALVREKIWFIVADERRINNEYLVGTVVKQRNLAKKLIEELIYNWSTNAKIDEIVDKMSEWLKDANS